jgi:ankyrin repeat protein
MQHPHSDILAALYRNDAAEAARLAEAAAALTIWEAAALGKDAVVARLALEDRGRVDAAAPEGHTPLGLAAFFGRAATVELLLTHGADPALASSNTMKVQPLHAAVAGRNAECVRAILDPGADPNARQQVGYTPLMGAASAGRQDLADLLVARGADRSLQSEDGKTAASVASEHGHASLATRLSAT